jgi:hypothetical protein
MYRLDEHRYRWGSRLANRLDKTVTENCVSPCAFSRQGKLTVPGLLAIGYATTSGPIQ